MRHPLKGSASRQGEAGFVVAGAGPIAGIIAILIGLLFPHLQTARMNANRARAEINLKRLCSAAFSIQQRTGQLPTDFGAIWTAAGFSADAGFAADGAKIGWRYGSYNRIMAEPLAGRTGAETLEVYLTGGCPIGSAPTPGTTAGYTMILENTMISSLIAIGQVLGGADGGLWNNSDAASALAQLAGPDGRYSLATLQSKLPPELRPYLEEVFATIQLGANGEQWQTFPSIAVIDGTSNTVFSLDALQMLTTRLIDRPEFAPELLQCLAAARLDPRALATYVARVEAVTSAGAFTQQEAVGLISVAKLLY